MSYLSRWLVFAFLLSLCNVFVSPVWASGEVQANVALEAGLFPLPEDAVVSAVLAGEDSSLKVNPPLAASANFIDGRQIMLQSVVPRLTRKVERDILMLRRGDKALLLGHSFRGSQQVILGAESTAVSLVLLHPTLLGLTAAEQQKVVAIIRFQPHFSALVKRLRGVLKVDQATPLDYLIHPFLGMDVNRVVEETIATPDFKAQITTIQLKEYAAERQKQQVQAVGVEKQGFAVDCQDKDGNTVEDCRKAENLSITNPKAIYYGAYIDPAKNDILDAKEGLINVEFGLWPPKAEFSSTKESKFNLSRFGTGGDSYKIHLVSNYGSSWNPLDAEGAATLMNSIKGVSLMVELAGLVPEGKSKTKDWIVANAQKLKGFQDSIIDKGKARWAIIISKAMTEVVGTIYDVWPENSEYKEMIGETYYGLKKFSALGDKLIDFLKLDPLQPEEIALQRDLLITTVFKRTNITELLTIIKSGQGLDVIYSKVKTELLVVIQQKFSFIVLNSDFPFDYDTVLQKISGYWTALETEGTLDSMLGVLLNDFTDEAAKAIGNVILRNAFGLPYKVAVAGNKIVPYSWDMAMAPKELTFPVYDGTLKALSEPNVASFNINRNGQNIYQYLADNQSVTPDFVRINPGDCINISYRVHMPGNFEQGLNASSDGFFSWFVSYPEINTFGVRLDALFERKPWSKLYDRTHLLTKELSVYRSGFDWSSPRWKYYRYAHGIDFTAELGDDPEDWLSPYQPFRQNNVGEIDNPFCFDTVKDIPDQLFLSFNNFGYESTGKFVVNLRRPNQPPTINSLSVQPSSEDGKTYWLRELDFIDDYTRRDDLKLEVNFGDSEIHTYQGAELYSIRHQYLSSKAYTVKVVVIDEEGSRSAEWSTTVYPGLIYPNLTVEPGYVNFGNVVLGKSLSNSITVSNTGQADLQLQAVTWNGSAFETIDNACKGTLVAGGKCTMTVRFTPNAQGITSGYLKINSNDPDSPETIVNLLGYGIVSPDYPKDYTKVFEPYEVERQDGTKYTVDTFNPSGVIYGNVLLKGGTLDLKNSDLTIYGHLIQSGGVLNVNGGKLTIDGDYRLQPPDG